MVLNPRLKVNQVLGYHEINSSMLQTNLSVGIDLLAGLLEGEDFPPDTIESRRLLDPGGVGWVQIDFGSGSEQIINLVRMSQTVPFSGRNTFLNGSHDSVNWLQVGDLSFKAKNPNSKLWNTQNREKFRFRFT